MGIYDKISRWLRGEHEQQYDNVKIINPADGTTIEGHDAVKEYFKKEQALLDEHGSSIIFQIYRFNLKAMTIKELQGEKLTEIKVGSEFVSGTDTVAVVKEKVRTLIAERARLGQETGVPAEPNIDETDRISFNFVGRWMQDDKLFYADHGMLLPVGLQVTVHRCEFEEVVELARKLRNTNMHRNVGWIEAQPTYGTAEL